MSGRANPVMTSDPRVPAAVWYVDGDDYVRAQLDPRMRAGDDPLIAAPVDLRIATLIAQEHNWWRNVRLDAERERIARA